MEEKIVFVQKYFGLKRQLIVPLFSKNLLQVDEKTKELEISISTTSYKNALSKYTEILNKYYPKPWKIYVLAKIKMSKGIKSYFDLFFHNSKKDIIDEMASFAPSYLLTKDDMVLLINIGEKKTTISNIGLLATSKRFIYKNYRYSVANEIKR